MSRKTELAKNTAILTVGKLCTQCISFFLLPLYTAILSTEEYGTFDLLVTYSTLLLPLVNWQLDQGLFRFMLDYRGNKEEQGKLFSTLLLSSTIQSIIYIILFVCVEPFLKIQNAYFLLLYVVLHVYTALFLQFVRGLGDSVKYTIASFIFRFGNNSFKCHCAGYFENGAARIVLVHSDSSVFDVVVFGVYIQSVGVFFC